jgi:hypothetical protein
MPFSAQISGTMLHQLQVHRSEAMHDLPIEAWCERSVHTWPGLEPLGR